MKSHFAILSLVVILDPGSASAQVGSSPHGALPAGLDCTACHRRDAWRPLLDTLRFDHAASTRFPLLASHREAECVSCHVGARFDSPDVAPDACSSCHGDPHAGALGLDCARCHVEESFSLTDGEEIHQSTRFPLEGAHLGVACVACHDFGEGATYTEADPACVTCHQGDYDSTSEPGHVAAGFPAACLECHSQVTWEDALFDHTANAGYSLVGAHEAAACTSCHVGPDFAPEFQPASADDCLTCHQEDYVSTSEPGHVAAGFAAACLECHSQVTWEDALFDHTANAGYPLVGAHEAAACTSCHVGPDFALEFQPASADDCYSCHEQDYASGTDHAAQGFPTACLDCHAQTAWTGASFTRHDTQYFPIYSGRHQTAWSTCFDCHQAAPQDFLVFTCLSCHEHSQAETNGRHGSVPDYVYDSIACYDCHPQGFAGDD
jgi:hypothetical protein